MSGAKVNSSKTGHLNLIVVQSIPNRSEAPVELRRRGFIVEVTSSDSELFAVALSQKLVCKIALQRNNDVKSFASYSSMEQLLLLQSAVDIILRSPDEIGIVHAWLPHDQPKYDAILKSKSSVDKIELVHQYYGPQIAFYFAWLYQYTYSLLLPALVGIAVYIHQTLFQDVDSTYMPYFAIILALWATLFLEFWKRTNATLAHAWNVLDIEENEIAFQLAKSAKKESGDRSLRLIFSFSATIVMVYILFRLMLYYVALNHSAEAIYGTHSWFKYYPMIMYSAIPSIAPMMFDPIAKYLNHFEAHPTAAESEKFLIYKKFALQFMNRNCALLYAAFWLRDLEVLRSLLVALLVTGAVINNALELGTPYINKIIKFITTRLFTTKKKKSSPADLTTVVEAVSPTKRTPNKRLFSNKIKARLSLLSSRLAEEEIQILLTREAEYVKYDLNEDYLEMLLQFGYTTMFGVAFPLTPLLAIVNNYFEVGVDLRKLGSCRRPKVVLRSGIGAWQNCLEVISILAVITNCFLLAIVSSKLHTIVPNDLQFLLTDHGLYGRVIIMIALEHVLLGIKVLLSQLIDDQPRHIREEQARQRVREVENSTRNRVEKFTASEQQRVMSNNNDSNLDDNQQQQQKEQTAIEEEQQQAIKSLQHQLNTVRYGFDPVSALVLFVTPLALHFLNISPWLYIPIAVLFFSYLQGLKDRQDRQAALGIVSDWKILRLLQSEVPGWLIDSEVQRVEWFNQILQKLWPFIAKGVELKVKEGLKPILESYKPFFLSELTTKHFSLGSRAPMIVGMRFFTTEESVVRFECEVRWSAEPLISFKVGTQPFPTMIELTNLMVSSAIIRVELLNLKYDVPPFEAISITCMKKPAIDFNLKIANLEILNLGPANFNVLTLVRNVINAALTEAMLYPKKMIIPIVSNVDTKSLAVLRPVAILMLSVDRAANLKQANIMGGSDPYVDIKSVDQTYRTAVKTNTLHPVWENESFEVLVYDISTQEVAFLVYDSDRTTGNLDKFLGKAVMSLAHLKPNKTIEKTLTLEQIERGTLTVTVTLVMLKSSGSSDSARNSPMGKRGRRKSGSGINPTAFFPEEEGDNDDILFAHAHEDLQTNDELLLAEDASAANNDEDGGYNSDDDDDDSDEDERDDQLTELASNHSSMPRARPLLKTDKSVRSLVAEGVGVLTISLIKLSKLIPPKDGMLWSSSLRPYVAFSVGDKTRKTSAQKGSVSPIFTESFSFLVRSLGDDVLNVTVLDHKKSKLSHDRLIGQCLIPLADMSLTGRPVEKEYALEAPGGHTLPETKVGFCMSWATTAK